MRGARAQRQVQEPFGSLAPSRVRQPRQGFRFLDALFEHSPDPLVVLDRQFNFVRVNVVFARGRQRKVSEFPGHNYFEFCPDMEDRSLFDQVLRSKEACQVRAKPFVFPSHPDWGVTYWDWSLVPVLDRRGDVEFLVLSLRDITMRQRMEQELQHNEERYRSLVTATAQIVWMTNPQGEIVRELPTWQGFTGQTREQYQGWGWTEALHPEDRQRVATIWANAVAQRAAYEAEYRLRRHDGQYRYVLARGVPVREDTGAIREWVGTCRDITDRKEAERRRDFTTALLTLFAQKTSSKEYLDAVVETIREWSGCEAAGIRVLDERREMPYASWAGFDPRFVELEHRVSLEHDTCCCLRAVSQTFEDQDRAVLTPAGSFRFDDTLRYVEALPPAKQARFRGNCFSFGYASLAIVPIRYREQTIGAVHLADRRPSVFPAATIEFVEAMAPLIGEAMHWFQAEAELAHYRDHLEDLVKRRTRDLEASNAQLQVEIAQRQRAQEILQQTAQELARSNRDLEQFAYVASHDLQEPLRAVGGYVRLLQHRFPELLDPKALEFIRGAAEGAERMERLITDLLAFARVGTHTRAFVVSDFNTLLNDALRNLQASITSAEATIHCEPLPSLPVDPSQIVQLFQNLVGNALKFRSERPLEISVGAKEEPGRRVFWVRDNGIGIDPQYFPRLFQIFQRLHTRRSYPGTGIGLAICKRIVERHGGTIWLESQPGEGSTFYFSLPMPDAISKSAV